MLKTNFHTHTCFCDGKDTPEALAEEALQRGFTHLGFSGHSYFYPDREVSMSPQNEALYRKQIQQLKQDYRGRMCILLGIEQDIFSAPACGYDYIIGSVHNVYKDGRYIPVDASPKLLSQAIEDSYGGSFDALAADYFALVATVVERTGANIIGHFDLVQKYSELLGFGESAAYLRSAEAAMDALIPTGCPFEINTGAMARQYRHTPYPSEQLLYMLYKKGGHILFSSDCHDKAFLNYGFDVAVTLAKKVGFTHHTVLTETGTLELPL